MQGTKEGENNAGKGQGWKREREDERKEGRSYSGRIRVHYKRRKGADRRK